MNKVEKSENKEARSYAESRLDYFRRKAAKCRKTLWWWQTIQGTCSDLVREISYLDDVIEMLEKAEVEG